MTNMKENRNRNNKYENRNKMTNMKIEMKK